MTDLRSDATRRARVSTGLPGRSELRDPRDIKEQRAFAADMAAARHPASGGITPNGSPDDATDRRFGPFNNEHMKILLDELVATYGN